MWKVSISACGTVIFVIHTPYAVSKGISGDRGGVFGENSFLCGKCQFQPAGPSFSSFTHHMQCPKASPVTEGEYSAKTVSYVESVNFSLRDHHFRHSHTT